ncbi:hypothetical protein [Paracoccus sp. JM45]|uniref:hypothetical protein n=1 Tax=Paracoccus sp. JM45 TaxID=2283626 RepID=UPI000E6BA1F6|nr:hypothetical protein [Paracoccus sp. JM45]RJE79098.1 hypothetical protein DWB67_14195 [Paracoccus sp. JM45]
MIRAHLASFPPRAGILMQTVNSILPQVDRLFICLNGYDDVPDDLACHLKIEVLIPDRDLKDAGKYAFEPADNDIVFTIDNDIVYPPDYVAQTTSFFDVLPADKHILGYLGSAWVAKNDHGEGGWKNWMFHKRAPHLMKVDMLGTGTACQLGSNLPRLQQIEDAAGFVDLRHANLHRQAGRWLWAVPRNQGYLTSTMSEELRDSSLFHTVNNMRPDNMVGELRQLMKHVGPHSGEQHARLRSAGYL